MTSIKTKFFNFFPKLKMYKKDEFNFHFSNLAKDYFKHMTNISEENLCWSYDFYNIYIWNKNVRVKTTYKELSKFIDKL